MATWEDLENDSDDDDEETETKSQTCLMADHIDQAENSFLKEKVREAKTACDLVEENKQLRAQVRSCESNHCVLAYVDCFKQNEEFLREVKRLKEDLAKFTQSSETEGFIQKKEVGPSNSLEVEDIADMYLDKLVERSLVQVASRRSDGGVKTCRVHDLLRDLCISESRENKFMEVCTNLDAIKCNSRRMSLQYRGELRLTEDTQSSARSLLLFGESTFWENESQGWKQIRNDFKLARVLDMNQVLLCLSPRGLKTLIHLRFLKVTASSTRIGNDVLASLCNLWNLETLYLWIEEPITLPNKIWKLKSLRHVYLDIDVYSLKKMWHIGASISKMKIGETKVENLQTLNNIYLNARTASVLKKGMFPNLTKLTLRKGPPEKEFLENSLRCLNKLRTLKLLCIEKLPLDPNAYPTNLTKITIGYFPQLDARMIKTLGRLSKLQILKLVDGGIYGDVNCVAGDFPQLQVLHLSEVQLDGRWKVEEGAMPQIRYCNDPLILDLER
ncbi:putative late blight resistance protein homolog R1A-3 [Arachis stenosperma]|uniref:putative late blight resistance protein homolog R1A-3 n=1 Tax=Arachis stenosperma TaxID=217475 RepID=UPI0025AC3B5C|nr:putative late blight resistance protein homolog R1A-3 [Arachis stenosperma]